MATGMIERLEPQPPFQAILLDRDGVINRERADYVKSWDEFEFLPTALAALRQLAGFAGPILVLTNQSAIGRGLVAAAAVEQIHAQAKALVAAAGGRIDRFFICPHHPADGCACRKPKPGLFYQAASSYGLDLRRCLFVGDALSDYQAAQAAGCAMMLVQSGRQGDQLSGWLKDDPAALIVPDLAAAVALLLEPQESADD